MLTLAGTVQHEELIKKSRFLAVAGRTDNVDEAMAFLERHADASASHNCWAYRVGDDYRFNDDGEPASTAGRPIFSAIEGQNLDHVTVLVVRYFGGIKLGAGGLARAYGGSAAECLRTAPVLEVVPRLALRIEAPFPQLGAVYGVLDRLQITRPQESFDSDGISLEIELPEHELTALRRQLADATSGEAHLIVTSTPGNDAA